MKKQAYIKAIDHCLEKIDDICSKCIYAREFDEEVDFESGCKPFDKDGIIACRNGIIKYFEVEVKQ